MVNLDKILKNGKGLFLAYDHGMEHGFAEFSLESSEGQKSEGAAGYIKAIDPQHILDIAYEGGFTAVILHKGLAEKYYESWGADERAAVPLIIKLNGKTNIPDLEPYSPMVCTVEEAVDLGASAVGYTVYLGSEKEPTMLWEFAGIVRDAHKAGIPAIGWFYPRGKWVTEKYGSDTNPEVVAYGARVGLELGADIVKLKYTGDVDSFSHVVKAAGRCKVVLSGGAKTDDPAEFLQVMKDVMAAGGIGVAVGRNVWKSEDPLKVTESLKEIIFG
jgi:class I fructose-bisphosphate aldolase